MTLLELRVKHLEKAHKVYESEVGSLEKAISEKVEFDFGVDYMPGDGFVLLNVETTNLAPLSSCIREIESSGSLTEDSHKSMCI